MDYSYQFFMLFCVMCGSFSSGFIIFGMIDKLILCPLGKIKPKKKKKGKNCKKIGDITLENWLKKIKIIQGELI